MTIQGEESNAKLICGGTLDLSGNALTMKNLTAEIVKIETTGADKKITLENSTVTLRNGLTQSNKDTDYDLALVNSTLTVNSKDGDYSLTVGDIEKDSQSTLTLNGAAIKSYKSDASLENLEQYLDTTKYKIGTYTDDSDTYWTILNVNDNTPATDLTLSTPKVTPAPTPIPTPTPDPEPDTEPEPDPTPEPDVPTYVPMPTPNTGNTTNKNDKTDKTGKTETVTNPDGSTTTTETKKDGTVVETTKKEDGSETKTETKKDGTVTETNTNADGSSTSVETKKDGTVTETNTNADGSSTSVETKKDGTVTETNTNPDGSSTSVETKTDGKVTETNTNATGTTATTVTDDEGNVTESKVTVSNEDANSDETVTLPVQDVKPTDKSEDAQEITVEIPEDTTVTVEIPVEDVTPGTVIIIVDEDGNETVVSDTKLTENGVSVTLDGNVTIKIVDNSKDFNDVDEDYWGKNAIDFVSSRELFSGVNENEYAPEESMTRAMLFTVLARLDGQDTTQDDDGAWYQKSMDWAKDAGISDGSDPNGSITREQLATMLYRYAGEPEVSGETGTDKFSDHGSVSDWAAKAMQWAVENGILNGMDDGTLNPQGNATRAQVATMLMRFLGK